MCKVWGGEASPRRGADGSAEQPKQKNTRCQERSHAQDSLKRRVGEKKDTVDAWCDILLAYTSATLTVEFG
jgi:hypothetical protein